MIYLIDFNAFQRESRRLEYVLYSVYLLHLPSLIEISPIAHVALLHTDMNSGFRFCPRMGINSAEMRNMSS